MIQKLLYYPKIILTIKVISTNGMNFNMFLSKYIKLILYIIANKRLITRKIANNI